jgi:hypothetical protein
MIGAVGTATGRDMLRAFAAGLLAELARLRVVVITRWREQGIRGFALTTLVSVAVVLAWLLDRTSAHPVITACCGERVGGPLSSALLRLPGSLVAPAPMLPVWGSLIQVLLAIGLAEAAVGMSRTVAVVGASQMFATLAGRYFVWYAPVALGGLPTSWRTALDTGPSAATVGLAVYLAIVLGCPRVGGVVIAGIAVAVVFAPSSELAWREHLVAVMVGAACAGVQLLAYRWSARRAQPDIGARGPVPERSIPG